MMRTLLIVLLCGCGDDPGPRPAEYTYIHHAIIVPGCASSGCHSTLTQQGGLVLDDDPAVIRERLIDKGFVYPGVIEASPLLHYLWGDAYVVVRMPPDAPLPKKDITLIERWIAAGAPL